MRIAITGTHGSGKTTLASDFRDASPSYEVLSEPYWQLVQEGVAFSARPTVEDLEAQLGYSCRQILDIATGHSVVFDRCPLDFLAYLDVVSAGQGFDWEPQGRLLGRIDCALKSLDTIIFVPLVEPDEIPGPIELPRLRARVDRRLKAMFEQDDLGLLADGPQILELSGSRIERLGKLLDHIVATSNC